MTISRIMLCQGAKNSNARRTDITRDQPLYWAVDRGPLLALLCMQGLSQYGNGFLAKFEAAACPNQLLEEVTLVDTPGVLSGEKQRIEVTSACASRC